MKNRIAICLFLVNLCCVYSQETALVKTDSCDCRHQITELDIALLCFNVEDMYEADEPEKGFTFAFEESLWKMSCAVPGVDTREEAIMKVQCMWNKYRERIRCYVHPTSIAVNKNITKFSLDINNTVFIYQAVRKYNLDMNFLDPADNKTFLDFVEEREEYFRTITPVDITKADEYQKIYQLLKTHGAKHCRELIN
ncbi:hypothetical protein [Flavobacterium sp. 245]|uniref:hypothetical protein n=1 Tax=Flavobacterium sp. 245 TaxID=2512115 RepID=UPI001062335C|nr:hypothetical protein [Flavobacterium sp. 245]TDP00711.1 hypothetical protein EV145_10590 [Flavobacterium sp. 245]